MRLKKPQPKSFLQPVGIIPGKVAACHQLDLWEHHNQLHQQSVRTFEIEVPKNILDGERAVGLPH